MRLSNKQFRGKRMELSMTSMIDVVFLLLIFFIVTTTFVRPEREVSSTILVKEKTTSANQSDLEPAIIDVLYQNSQVVYRIGAVRTGNIEEVTDILKEFDNKSEGAFVRVAGDAPYEAAAQAIGACRAGGFQSVSYLPLN